MKFKLISSVEHIDSDKFVIGEVRRDEPSHSVFFVFIFWKTCLGENIWYFLWYGSTCDNNSIKLLAILFIENSFFELDSSLRNLDQEMED